MKMKRELIAGIVIGVMILLTLVTYLRRGEIKQDSAPPDVKTPVQGEIVSFAESGISEEILKSLNYKKGEDGVKTVLPDNYERGTPVVELFFLKRNLDGSTEPLELSSVEVVASNKGGGPWIGVDGANALRMAVTTNYGGLIPGETYRIRIYFTAGRSTSVKTAPLNPVFQVPRDLPPNSVYRVNLIIKDEIVEQQVLAQKQAKGEEMKRLAVEEQIIVHATDDLPGRLLGVYQEGTRSREFSGKEGERSIVLQGPNKLGGELAVYGMAADGRMPEAWAYTPKLDKRQVDMPKDAQLMVKQSDLVPITISLSRPRAELFSRYRRVAFYFSEATHWPLFTARLPPWPAQEEPGTIPVSIRVKPGTYAVRLMGDKMESLPLTKLTIDSEPSRTYTVELPTAVP